MPEGDQRRYDLEERSFRFASSVRVFCKKLPRTIANSEDVRQIIRSSGSIGANYIEANEALGQKDFILRVRISRKEAKETIYWLRLLDLGADDEVNSEGRLLLAEAKELLKILSAILVRFGQNRL